MVQLRDYQQRLADEIIEALDREQRPVAASPTGSGKSHVIGDVVRREIESGRPATVLCHRREIALHLQRVLHLHTGIRPALAMADAPPTEWSAPLVLGMVPTLSRRLRTTPADRGGLVLLDEAHHATAATWRRVVEHLAPVRLAGVTATAVSCNKEPLGKVFDQLVLGPQPAELVAEGHLCPARVLAAETVIDVKGVHTRHGDFVVGELEDRARSIAGRVVPTWKDHANGMQTLVACCTVRHAIETAELFRRAGVAAAHLDGSMGIPERDRILQDFAQGRITVLTFMGMVDEGLDIPEAEAIQFLRPTRSLRLRRQLEGRIRRPHPRKEVCLILDHTPSWQWLPAPDEVVRWSLDAGGEAGAVAERLPNVRPKRQSDGTVVLAEDPVEVRDVTFDPRRRRPGIVRQLDDPLAAGRLLGAIERGTYPLHAVVAQLKGDPEARLQHYRLVGQAAGYLPGWAHHRYRNAVLSRGTEHGRKQLHRLIEQHLRSAADRGEIGRSVVELVKVLGIQGGQVVITVADQSGMNPVHPRLHRRAKAKLEKALEAFSLPVEVIGFWGGEEPPNNQGFGSMSREQIAALMA